MSNFEKSPKVEKLLNSESLLILSFVVLLIVFMGFLGYLNNKREMRNAYLKCVTNNGASTVEVCEKLLK